MQGTLSLVRTRDVGYTFLGADQRCRVHFPWCGPEMQGPLSLVRTRDVGYTFLGADQRCRVHIPWCGPEMQGTLSLVSDGACEQASGAEADFLECFCPNLLVVRMSPIDYVRTKREFSICLYWLLEPGYTLNCSLLIFLRCYWKHSQ